MPPAASATDAELILAVLERDDRRAFSQLVNRHQSRVRTVLRRLTKGDAALADNLAQETFVLAWKNLRHFRFEARFSTWIYRIAFNAWQSEARKKREVLLDDPDDIQVADDSRADLPDAASRIDLERALATLSDGERSAIAACYYGDLSHEEAAQALGIPLGTVKTHVLRAKAKLRAAHRKGRDMKTLEELLLEDAQAPLADDFFTARVMGALPERSPRAQWWKALLILGSTALGGLLAALFAPSGTSALQGVLDLAASHYMTPSALAVVGTAITLAIAGAVLAADE